MSVIFKRSAAPTWWGYELPREIAYLTKNHSWDEWKPVTFKQLNQRRTDQIRANERQKRKHPTVRAGYVWVFYNPGWLFGGWYCYILGINRDIALNFRTYGRNREILPKVMALFNCGVEPVEENRELWMRKFAKKYAHVGFNRKKFQGLVKCRLFFDADSNLVNVEKWKAE